ncbi:MAG: PAS domain S-box protein [Fibrobacterota bacterium]
MRALMISRNAVLTEKIRSVLTTSGISDITHTAHTSEALALIRTGYYHFLIIYDASAQFSEIDSFINSIRTMPRIIPPSVLITSGDYHPESNQLHHCIDAVVQYTGSFEKKLTEHILALKKRRKFLLPFADYGHSARYLINSIPDTLILTDIFGVIIDMNKSADSIADLLQEDSVMGKSIFALSRKKYIQDIRRIPSDDSEKNLFECKARTQSLGLMYLDIRIIQQRDVHGRRCGYLITVKDSTDIRRKEMQLKEEEVYFRTLADSGQALIWVSGVDKKCHYFNSVWLEFRGRSLAQEQGFGWLEGVHPDDMDRCKKIYTESFDARHPFSMDYRLLRHDGVYRWMQDDGTPRYNSQNQFIGYIGHCLDITDRKHAEERLKRLQLAIEQVAETIVITDVDGTVQYVNSAFEYVTGYTKNEILGENPRILQSGEHSRQFYETMWDTLSQGRVWRGRIVNRKKDGARYTEEAIISPVRNTKGETIAYVAVKLDITDELQREKQLRQSEKMEAIGHLAGGIAHDFNNILAGIIGFAEVSCDELGENSWLRDNLRQIIKAGDRAKALISQILSFSRQDADTVKPLYLKPIVKEVVNLLTATLPSTITLKSHISKETAPVMGNETRFHEVLMNMATNAVHAMKERGQLSIQCTEVYLESSLTGRMGNISPGAYTLLEIADTGTGIDEKTLQHMFEPFYTTKEIGRGTGMGLSVVFGIIKKYGGNICVSTALGKGTTFSVYLPKCRAEISPRTSAFQDVSFRGTGEKILFVDDEEVMTRLGRILLEDLAYSVDTFTDSAAALEAFKEDPDSYDVLVTDQTMPVMTGVELAQEVHTIRPNVPVILCTGYSGLIDEKGALKKGIQAFLMKPYKKREIGLKIRAVLEERASSGEDAQRL